MLDDLKQHLTRNALRYHVGHAIFCPRCGAIMDCRRAVELDIYNGEQLFSTRVWCAKCFDAHIKSKIPTVPEGSATRFEINDGRELFKRPARRKKVA